MTAAVASPTSRAADRIEGVSSRPVRQIVLIDG
jgi:hypothetical protein